MLLSIKKVVYTCYVLQHKDYQSAFFINFQLKSAHKIHEFNVRFHGKRTLFSGI